MRNEQLTVKALSAVTATTTSSPVPVNGFRRITIFCTSTAISGGNGVFTVECSADGTNWKATNKLISNVTNTNAQTLTRVASLTLSTNTTEFITVSPDDAFSFIRVKVTVTTDGTYTAYVTGQA